jgi:hypothetical protein
MLIDRLDYMARHVDYRPDFGDRAPSDVLREHFWFTTFSDPSTMPLRHLVGVDHIMLETDFPHSDSTWPDTQDLLTEQLAGVPQHEVDAMTYGNAAKLYGVTIPGLN